MNSRTVKSVVEALKVSNSLSSISPSLSYTERATNVAKKAAQNWAIRDVRTQKSKFPTEAVIFVNKPPKEFSLDEVASFVRHDATLRRSKIRFVANDARLDGDSISPSFRRLVNNGVYYTVFGNTPERTQKVLQDSQYNPLPLQVTLVEAHRSGQQDPSYREIPNAPVNSLVQIEIDQQRYSLSTPSLALLVRMKGVGVPLNHPEHSKLSGVTVPHPLNASMPLVFHSIPERDDKTLLALIPGHVQEHRAFFSGQEPVYNPGVIEYEGEKHSLSQLNEIIAQRLGVTAPLITTAPFIVSKHFNSDGESISTIHNGEEILDSSKFYNLPLGKTKAKSGSIFQMQVATRTKEYPLNQINSGEVYDMLSFSAKSEMFSKIGVITSDMLRGVILDSNVISDKLLIGMKDTLTALDQVMHWYKQSEFLKDVEWVGSLKEMLLLQDSKPEDVILVKSFYGLSQDPKELNNFVMQLSNYTIFLQAQESFHKGLTPERVEFVTKLLGNVMVRCLQDPLRRLFPEFSQFWIEELQMDKVRSRTLAKGNNKNKWDHYIEYIVEKHISRDQHELSQTQALLNVTSALYSMPHLPAPYNVGFQINGIDEQHQDFLKYVAVELLNASEVSFNVSRAGRNEGGRFYSESPYHSKSVQVVPYRIIPDLTTLNEHSEVWCALWQALDLGESWNIRSLGRIKSDLRQSVKYQEHYLISDELCQLYRFLATVFKSPPIEFNDVMKEYRDKVKRTEITAPGEAFRTLDPDHVEKEINEFI